MLNSGKSERILRKVSEELSKNNISERFARPTLAYLKGLSKYVDIEGVLLYGSVAWGKPTIHSDIDLIIVSTDFDLPYDELVKMRRRIRGELPGGIDSIWVSPRELESMFLGFTGFILDAIWKGIILYEENEVFTKLRKRLEKALETGKIERKHGMWKIPISRPGEKVEIEI